MQPIKQQTALKDLKNCTSKQHKTANKCHFEIPVLEDDFKYPRWYEWAFFGFVSTIIALVFLGFMYV